MPTMQYNSFVQGQYSVERGATVTTNITNITNYLPETTAPPFHTAIKVSSVYLTKSPWPTGSKYYAKLLRKGFEKFLLCFSPKCCNLLRDISLGYYKL